MQPDTILNQRYRLIEPVGEGGMATVYRAVDARLGRTVAIKVLHPEFARDQPFLQRFQHEAEFAASLGAHPNIVDIYDIGQDGGFHYIVMEFVEGHDLKRLIEQRAPFSVAETFSIGQQVASALDFAHKRGLVHRDVKPQNIMVTTEGPAKVTDFGIARSVSTSQLTRTGMVMGTVHYFSPEQAQGKPAGPPTDIYSLGIILYEMLTRHLPFDAENAIGVAMQHLHSEPPSPWDYNPDLPARAVATVMRALEKDPERRYRDAAEFAQALASQAGPAAETLGMTSVSPIVAETRQRTAMYQPVEPLPPPQREPVATQRAVAAPVERQVPKRSNTMWYALGAALLAVAVAFAAYFVTSHVLGAATGPSTPTRTPKPTAKPKPKKTPKPTRTVAVPVVVQPTLTTAPALPTSTTRPLPTSTPKPKPKPTPKPRPTPTVPVPTPTTVAAPVGTGTAVG